MALQDLVAQIKEKRTVKKPSLFDRAKSVGSKALSTLKSYKDVDPRYLPSGFADTARRATKGTQNFAEEAVRGTARASLATGAFINKLNPLLKDQKPYQAKSEFAKSFVGTDKPVTLTSVGRETRFADPNKQSEGFFKGFDPALGLAVGAVDLIPGGKASRTIPAEILSRLVRTNDSKVIEKSIEQFIPEWKGTSQLKLTAEQIAREQNPQKIEALISRAADTAKEQSRSVKLPVKSELSQKPNVTRGPSGTAKIKNIPADDLKRVTDFTERIATGSPTDVKLEIDVRRLAERYNLNPDVDNADLAKAFSRILKTETKDTSKEIKQVLSDIDEQLVNSLNKDESGIREKSLQYFKDNPEEITKGEVRLRETPEGNITIEDGRHRLKSGIEQGVVPKIVDVTAEYGLPPSKRVEDLIKRLDRVNFINEFKKGPAYQRLTDENDIVFDKNLVQLNKELTNIFGEQPKVNITTETKDLGGKAGVTVYGRATAEAISLLQKYDSLSQAVAKHEGWHWFKRQLADSKKTELDQLEKELFDQHPDRVAEIKKDYRKKKGETDEEYNQRLAEELMADEFARYYRTGNTIMEKLQNFFEDAIEALELIFRKRGAIMRKVGKEFKGVKETLKKDKAVAEVETSPGFKQKVSAEEFKNFEDLSTKLLGKLEGKTTVSKQFISDLTNSPDLKQPERDLFRRLLEGEEGTINVKDFANKVKTELLPLSRNELGITPYENISLPEEMRGPVSNYAEHIYESPIKTSAGNVHYSSAEYAGKEGYFAHSRIEDLADGQTRRVIEAQSDLFQKGRLEGEVTQRKADFTPTDKKLLELYRKSGNNEKYLAKLDEIEQRGRKELSKLEPYRNTWHERIVREEVKRAAQDGKTKLQFPTGETAMKIEGLGDNRVWSVVKHSPEHKAYLDMGLLEPDTIKVGEMVARQGDRDQWIITDVLGDGKFKAIQKKYQDLQPSNWKIQIEDENGNVFPDKTNRTGLAWVARNQKTGEMLYQQWGQLEKKQLARDFLMEKIGGTKDKTLAELGERYGETFDISGKVDTNNPIYKFYEKEMGKYLKNKFGAELVTDPQGVKWYEVKITKDMADKPVEAFKQVSEIDRLIADGKVRVMMKNGKDTYQIKKGDTWKTVRDEDSAIKQLTPKAEEALPDDLEAKKLSLEIRKEAIDNDPAASLAKYASKRGDFRGQLKEVTGGAKNSKFGKGGDDIATEAGFEDSETARQAYEEWRIRKADVEADLADFKDEVKIAKTLKSKDTKAIDALDDQDQILDSNRPELVDSLETASLKSIEDLDLPPSQKPLSLEEIVTRTPVSAKVNILDYIRTPDRVLKKLGFEKESKLLRTKFDDYVKELPKNIQTITDWTKRVPKDASERIFKYLDGQEITLSTQEQKVAEEIRDYLANWADRLKLPQDKRVTNYITRLFDDQLIAKEFDEDLAKIIADKVPGEVYNPFLEKRLGALGYKQDVWQALDAYTKRATRKVHLDEALEKIKDKAGSSLEYSNLEKSQFDYIKRYVDRVNMRPTELDNLLDNTIKNTFGYRLGQRPVTRITSLLRRMTYRGMLGANLGSALRNLSQGANTYAVLGERDFVNGYMKLFSPSARAELEREGVLANNFIQDRTLSSTKQMLQKADKALWFLFDQAEKINRGGAYLGAKNKGLRKGMTEQEAIDYAKSIVRKTQFNYDSVDTPVALSPDMVKSLFQFQTFTTKQIEFLTELAKDKNFAALARYAIGGLTFVWTIGQAMGMEEKELLPMYRFDVPPSLKFPVETVKAVMGTEDKYGNERDIEKRISDVAKSAIGLIPGGMQLKKTIEGAKAVEEGGSFNKAGTKMFDVGGTPFKDIQATVFGKYANPEAKEYFKKGTGDDELDELTEAQNEADAEFKERVRNETKTFKELQTKEEKKQFLLDLAEEDEELVTKLLDTLEEEALGLTPAEEKLRNAKVSVRAQYIAKELQGLDSKEEKAELLREYAEKKILTESVLDELETILISN